MKILKRGKTLLALTTLAVTMPIAWAAEQTTPDGPWPGWHGWHSHSPGLWWICPLMMMFMFIIFFVIFSGRRRWYRMPWWREWMNREHFGESPEDFPDKEPESALQILDKRYALGEIEKEEYEEKKAAIISSNI